MDIKTLSPTKCLRFNIDPTRKENSFLVRVKEQLGPDTVVG